MGIADDLAGDTRAIETLARYRILRDLSYEGLAAQMAARGFAIKPRALNYALAGHLQGLPRERTRFKIRAFVAAHVRLKAGKRRARRVQ